MVIPGHRDDASRPILRSVTKGWGGKEPQSFTKVMRQVKVRLIEASGAIHVVVLCDCRDSTSFEEEHRDELSAFNKNGVRFAFVLFVLGVSARASQPGFGRVRPSGAVRVFCCESAGSVSVVSLEWKQG